MQVETGTDKIQAGVEQRIGWLTFNNPRKHNALSLEMWRGITAAMTFFAQDEATRLVVLRGAGGKAFVSGADISEFDQVRSSAEQKRSYAKIAGAASLALATFNKPLIAMIEGYCIGGGLATALSADVRFSSPDAQFGIPAAKLGLGYEYEGLAKLARLVGPARARDMLFSARRLDAEEAKRFGLVNAIYSRAELESKTLAYAERVAANAPLTVQAAKAALNAWERGGRETEVQAANRLVDACFDSADYKEGRRAFREKRTPDFNGR